MSWSKPKKVWHWLLLLSPGALSVALTAFGKLALSTQNEIGPSIVGVLLLFPLSLVIAILLARGAEGAGKMLGLALLFFVLLVIVNFSIACGGCAVMNPHMDFR
jgi:hypothetical protein